MGSRLVQPWNSDPPPTPQFLEQLERWREACGADGPNDWDRCEALIDAISTPQDLAQFLLERSHQLRGELIENPTVDRFWDALAGVLVADAEQSPPSWRRLARMLSKALDYE